MKKKQWDNKQQQAITMMCDVNITKMYISGQAGTGKSEIIKYVSTILTKDGWWVSITAPTGKASKRIGGTTIHKWLQPNVEEDKWGNLKIIGWRKNSFSNKECLIIDESSMLDNTINDRINTIFDNTDAEFIKKIIYVGDPKQLPPVEGGAPFIHFINNNNPGIELENIYRQEGNNDITIYAGYVRNKMKVDTRQWHNVQFTSLQAAIDAVVSNQVDNQIICPKRKRAHGTDEINKQIQELLNYSDKVYEKQIWVQNQQQKWYLKKDYPIFKNNKIIITKNHWEFDVTNGTTCIVQSRGFEKINQWPNLMVWTDVVYLWDCDTETNIFLPTTWLQKNSELAYALTVHKFQGSQAKHIYFVITPDQVNFINAQMFYTGITRAEKMLYLIK